jgi:hypothetical protein
MKNIFAPLCGIYAGLSGYMPMLVSIAVGVLAYSASITISSAVKHVPSPALERLG